MFSVVCIVLVAYRTDSSFPLVVAANRDEFFDRPSIPAHFWTDEQNIFAGRDVKGGGTWLGVTRSGRFAALTNWTEQGETVNGQTSRGLLVRNFLSGTHSSEEYIDGIEGTNYQGFNLLVYDGEAMMYWSNRDNHRKLLDSGFYGVTNTSFQNDWTKTRAGIDMISQIQNRHDVDTLIHLLRRHSSTEGSVKGRSQSPEDSRSPCFVFGDDYGTRASTAVVFDGKRIFFKEQLYGPRAVRGSYVYESIPLEKEKVK